MSDNQRRWGDAARAAGSNGSGNKDGTTNSPIHDISIAQLLRPTQFPNTPRYTGHIPPAPGPDQK